jgi:outer membrane protein assembly factor BamB
MTAMTALTAMLASEASDGAVRTAPRTPCSAAARISFLAVALAASACNSLEAPMQTTAAAAAKPARSAPRLSESVLASHGLREVWYLGEVLDEGGPAGVKSCYLLKEGLFAVTSPSKPKAKRHLVRFHRQTGESMWYEDLPGDLEHAPYAYHYPPTAGRGPELFFTHEDDLYCLDLDTGQKLWSRTVTIPISTAVIADERHVYAGSNLNMGFAVPKRGSVESWTYRMRGRIEAAPLFAGDKVVFASHDGHVVGLYPDRGWDTVRSWDHATGAAVRGDMAAYDRWIFVGSEDYKLYCLRLDGGVQWSYVAESRVIEPPVVFRARPNREFVYCVAERDPLRGTPRALLAIPLPRSDAAASAQPAWRVENVRKVVTIGQKNLYVLIDPGVAGARVLAALDIETGKERFRIDVEGFNFVPTNLADYGRDPVERGRIYLVSQSGAIQVIGEKLE